MELTVYADILFVVNFTMDYLALYITAFILKRRFRIKRGVLAAIVGGIYGVLSVALGIGGIENIGCSILISAVMCLVLNGFSSGISLLREIAVFFVSNLIIGGGMTAIYAAFNSFGAVRHLIIYGEVESVEEQMPLALFAVGSFIMTVILVVFGRAFNRRKTTAPVSIQIRHGGRAVAITATEDTGNFLTEPLSGQPVVIISRHEAEKLLDMRLLRLVTEMRTEERYYPVERIRFLICETVAGRKTLGAFKPDAIYVNGRNVSAWVAVSEKSTFSGLSTEGAIVPSGLVNI